MGELTNYKISNHCEQRYAERLLGKDSKVDINKFIVENKEKIKTDINKMITYGNLIFSGKQYQKDGKGSNINVYLKDTWIVLVDPRTENTITLYRIDLGLDDDFNLQYISKMMDKLNVNKEKLEVTKTEVATESSMYREMINDAESQINEYKSMIKNLEELCSAYKAIIDNNTVKVAQANREVAETVNKLIGKREF